MVKVDVEMSKIDITENDLVPEHIPLSEEEEEEFLVKYGITRNNLPLIKSSDPIIKALEERDNVSLKGKIIKIIRHNSPAGEGIYYRYVID
ncbi:MAG TPA: DNA-directed RNA polymerase subunit RpoH/Rpb5 C-terminal domain-containing protein [Candidatus Methanofastidiosa archaeon]|nr:DNA-directed RNA polymerase subunit RpoH/Rpb5 C-terminal domain-containing protein [Candidatus Methanofastidiosa archaeon]